MTTETKLFIIISSQNSLATSLLHLLVTARLDPIKYFNKELCYRKDIQYIYQFIGVAMLQTLASWSLHILWCYDFLPLGKHFHPIWKQSNAYLIMVYLQTFLLRENKWILQIQLTFFLSSLKLESIPWFWMKVTILMIVSSSEVILAFCLNYKGKLHISNLESSPSCLLIKSIIARFGKLWVT